MNEKHFCIKEEEWRVMGERMSAVETYQKTAKDEVKEVKASISKMTYWIMGVMGTTILTLITLLFKH